MTTITLSDGTTTINLTDASNGYNMMRQSYAPKVSVESESRLAGKPYYEDVLDTMQIEITGSTSTQVLSRLGTLTSLLSGSNSWKKGAKSAALTINYQPTGASNTSSAVIRGVPEDFVSVPDDFEFLAGNIFRLHPVTIRFYRSGLWYYGTQTSTSASSGATTPQVMSITGLTAETLMSPAKLVIDDFTGLDNATAIGPYSRGYIAVSWGSDMNEIENAPVTAGWSGYNVSTGASSYAQNGAYGVFYPTSAAASQSNELVTSWSGSSDFKTLVPLAVVRNLSSTVSYKMRIQFDSGRPTERYTRWMTIPASSTHHANVVSFGAIQLDQVPFGYIVHLEASTSATTSGNALRIDYLGFFEINHRSRVIRLDKFHHDNAANELRINPGFVDKYAAEITQNGTYNIPVAYRGDPYLIGPNATSLTVTLLGTTLDTTDTFDFGARDGNIASSPTLANLTTDLTLWKTSLTPAN